MALSVRLPNNRAELAGRSGQAPPGTWGMAERGLLRAPHRACVQTAARGITPMRRLRGRSGRGELPHHHVAGHVLACPPGGKLHDQHRV